MADNFTNQLLQTVRNKVSLTGGLSIRSMPVPGTLSDMQNFKIEDGVLKLRDGTKKIASLKNKRFYFLKSFEFCGSEVLFGLDMQRRLYAWFQNYEGVTFTVRDQSQFHKNAMVLDDWKNGVLFPNGSKFWAFENQKHIMFFNNFGEIRLIIKDGGFKVAKDEERDENGQPLSFIYVDIKDATNRVFDVSPSLKTDTRNIAPRITGEVRFARVNEMGVISELTEPQYLQNYESKFASRYACETFKQQDAEIVREAESKSDHYYITSDANGINYTENSWSPPTYDKTGTTDYDLSAMIIVAPEGLNFYKDWSLHQYAYSGHVEFENRVEEINKEGYSFEHKTIPRGIYLLITDSYLINNWINNGDDNNPDWVIESRHLSLLGDLDKKYSLNPSVSYLEKYLNNKSGFIELDLKSSSYPQYDVHKKERKTTKLITRFVQGDVTAPIPYRAFDFRESGFSFSQILFYRALNGNIIDCEIKDQYNGGQQDMMPFFLATPFTKKPSVDSSYNFDILVNQTVSNFRKFFHCIEGTWFRLQDNDDLYREAEKEHLTMNFTLSDSFDLKMLSEMLDDPSYSQFHNALIEGAGKIYAVDAFPVSRINNQNNRDYLYIRKEAQRAFRYKKKMSDEKNASIYSMELFDTFKYKQEYSDAINIGQNAEFNVGTGSLTIKFDDKDVLLNKDDILKTTDRFAIWNNGKILGISQRLFTRDGYTPIYEIEENENTDNLKVMYSPVLSLDFMNYRAFNYDLPLISRAIRRPNHLCVSNNVVYSFEENRLWYGDAYDFMLKGYANLDGTLKVMIPYNEGVLACTTSGLYYVRKEDVQPVVNGRNIVAEFAGQSQVGGLVFSQNKIYLVRTEITDSGARIETSNIISIPIEDVVFEGKIKVACNKRQIYIADDFNVFGFDTEKAIWNLRYNYNGKRISDIYILDGRLGVLFDNQVDESEVYKLKKTSEILK